MRNVKEQQLKKAIVFETRELADVLSEIFKDNVVVDIDYEGLDITFDRHDTYNWYAETMEALSEYLDVQVTSMHVDQFDYPFVWIIYKEN